MALVAALLASLAVTVQPPPPASGPHGGAGREGCLSCHAGIEPIREPETEMMQRIYSEGRRRGDPAGCVVCHGGNVAATDIPAAHGGETGEGFYADPGASSVNRRTCGQCHIEHVSAQPNSPMMTQAGKIQGALWAFGGPEGRDHKLGTQDASNPPEAQLRQGETDYGEYMESLRKEEGQAFPNRLTQVPAAPGELTELAESPHLAAFTLLRAECLHCHLDGRGPQRRGDFRGMGCSACHIPYAGEGRYEGADSAISRERYGRPLVHRIQATEDAAVTVGGKTYSGIPIETCGACHHRGKRIAPSYQGLMEATEADPTSGRPVHGRLYRPMQADVHMEAGLLCGDCHTSIDVHGDGFLAATNLAQIEIECSDCHGTPAAYPWELPLGFGDEFGNRSRQAPRGTTTDLPSRVRQGSAAEPMDGYLLSARGNPLPNVARSGNSVRVSLASGTTSELQPLRALADAGRLSPEGRLAMLQVSRHMDSLECYACHTGWAPQCYGCHMTIDYSEGKQSRDWLQPRNAEGQPALIPGSVSDRLAFSRTEDPALARSGEGRIAPAIPGCQVAVTLIDADGRAIVRDHVFPAEGAQEGAAADVPLAADFSPGNPHTTTAKPRSCESCHLSPKAMGFGSGAVGAAPPDALDLRTASGEPIPGRVRAGTGLADELLMDWTRLLTDSGDRYVTVGHHFSGSRALSPGERAVLDKSGVCLSCHQDIPSQTVAASVLSTFTRVTRKSAAEAEGHKALNRFLLRFTGLAVLLLVVAVVGGASLGLLIRYRRRRPRPVEEEVPRRPALAEPAPRPPAPRPPRGTPAEAAEDAPIFYPPARPDATEEEAAIRRRRGPHFVYEPGDENKPD